MPRQQLSEDQLYAHRFSSLSSRDLLDGREGSDFLIGSRSPELEDAKGKNGKATGLKAGKNGHRPGDPLHFSQHSDGMFNAMTGVHPS